MMTLMWKPDFAVVYRVLVDVKPCGIFFFFPPFHSGFVQGQLVLVRFIFYSRGVVYCRFCYEALYVFLKITTLCKMAQNRPQV